MPYSICSIVAVFKMLVRILNTLRSRIWDRVFFLFSDYLNLWFNSMECARRLWFSLEWTSPEGDTFLLDYIKITFIYSCLMENFSLFNSHNLLENPLLFPPEITNLLFVIKTRQPLKQNFILNCKKTMIKKKELW